MVESAGPVHSLCTSDSDEVARQVAGMYTLPQRCSNGGGAKVLVFWGSVGHDQRRHKANGQMEMTLCEEES